MIERIHHKPIKRFSLSGNIYDDKDLARLKLEYIKIILMQMQFAGYVPRVDIDTDFTMSYNYKKEYFEFELSVYGIYVGKKKVEWIIGVNGSQVLYSPQNKLKESLSESA